MRESNEDRLVHDEEEGGHRALFEEKDCHNGLDPRRR
jgi:hypothetical protein